MNILSTYYLEIKEAGQWSACMVLKLNSKDIDTVKILPVGISLTRKPWKN